MKRKMILLFLLALFGFTIRAQELTLETTAGNLHSLVTAEQQKSVTSLTLKGSMDDSDFYFIRDEMTALESLNIKEIEVDTIPPRSLYSRIISKTTLPSNIKYIGEEAFRYTNGEIIITGDFPELGARAFGGRDFTRLNISEDNQFCISIGEAIYSADGKILHYFNDSTYYRSVDSEIQYRIRFVQEGTEIIGSRAFDNCKILQITFPSSIKRIEKHAFENAEIFGITDPGWTDHPEQQLIFQSNTPPVLVEEIFSENEMFTNFSLVVPQGLESIYKAADEQWSVFMNIESSGIRSFETSDLNIWRNENMLFVNSDKLIGELTIFDMQSRTVYASIENGTKIEIPFQQHGIYLLKVLYSDHTMDVIKFHF